jgi:multimeric flavodoxin WrbA
MFSAPTRFGVSASQLRAFIDSLGPLWAQGKLVNKAVTAMSNAANRQLDCALTLGVYSVDHSNAYRRSPD